MFCGQITELVHVHGHYQCSFCNTNALPCCDGDNCDTNLLLNENSKPLAIKIKNEKPGKLLN